MSIVKLNETHQDQVRNLFESKNLNISDILFNFDCRC
jgi:hypothetical protein